MDTSRLKRIAGINHQTLHEQPSQDILRLKQLINQLADETIKQSINPQSVVDLYLRHVAENDTRNPGI